MKRKTITLCLAGMLAAMATQSFATTWRLGITMAMARAFQIMATTRSMALRLVTMVAVRQRWRPPTVLSTPIPTAQPMDLDHAGQCGHISIHRPWQWLTGKHGFDMADFQASTFGSVKTTYNGIVQNWSFNDGFPTTKIRFFDLAQDVIDSINLLGSTVAIESQWFR